VSPNAKALGYGEHGSLKTDKSYRPFHLIPCVIYELHEGCCFIGLTDRCYMRASYVSGLTENIKGLRKLRPLKKAGLGGTTTYRNSLTGFQQFSNTE